MTTTVFERFPLVIVLASFEIGGSERQALRLATEVKKHGGRVHIWGLRGGPLLPAVQQLGISCGVLPQKNSGGVLASRLRRFFMLRSALSKPGPCVVLPFTTWPNTLCGLVWRLSGARLCIWNQRDEWTNYAVRPIHRLAVMLTPLVVANSLPGAQRLRELFPRKRAVIRVLPNGIALPPPSSTSTLRTALGLSPDDILVCMVANLHWGKDHETLLYAWKVVSDQMVSEERSAVLLLVGRDDASSESVRDTIQRLSLENSVRLTGPVDDPGPILQDIDIGVLISNSEGCPNAVLEYMAFEKPVIATNIQAIRDVVGSAGEPWLARPRDVQGLALLLVDLIRSRAARERLGRQMHERVSKHFPMKQSYSQLEDLVSTTLDSSTSRRHEQATD